jgi:hypothetical protein
MYAMGIADDEQVPYAASIIMEIHEKHHDKFYVKVSPLCCCFLHKFLYFIALLSTQWQIRGKKIAQL